eukprot:754943-Hanusia_phi.AAC.2
MRAWRGRAGGAVEEKSRHSERLEDSKRRRYGGAGAEAEAEARAEAEAGEGAGGSPIFLLFSSLPLLA